MPDSGELAVLKPGEVAITREKMAEMLEEGAARVRSAMVGSKQAALDAQAEAHKAEISRLLEVAAAEKIEAQKDAHAHGFHKAAWMVGFPAVLAGILMALAAVSVVSALSSEATVRGAGVGSAIRAQDENRDALNQRRDEMGLERRGEQ